MSIQGKNTKTRKDNDRGRRWIVFLLCALASPQIFHMIAESAKYELSLLLPLASYFYTEILCIAGSISILAAPMLFLRIRTAFWVLSPLVVWGCLETYHLFLYHHFITAGAIEAVLNTNLAEALGFTGHHIVVIVPLFVVICLSYIYATVIIVPDKFILSRLNKIFVIFTAISVVILLAVGQAIKNRWSKSAKITNPIGLKESVIYNISDTYPVHSIVTIYRFFESLIDQYRYETELKSFQFGAKRSATPNERSICVLIIGESSRYDHWGINGYSRNTTPRLSTTDGLISYKDVSATSCQTTTALRLMLTSATPATFTQSFKEKSLITAFREVGFSTFWISNQSRYDWPSNEASQRIALNIDWESEPKYDGALLPILQQAIRATSDDLFIVIHTMGSHFPYVKRYPPNYEVFTPSTRGLIAHVGDPAFKQESVNSYDNSILYTDHIVSEVIKTVAESNSIASVVYISDHGQALLDDARGLWGHGDSSMSKYILSIPLLIWLSPEYKNTFPEKTFNILNNREKKISTDNLFHTVLDINGLELKKLDKSKSIASDKLKEAIRYVYAKNQIFELKLIE